MPNTLAHIGLQTPLTRLGLRKAPLQWIALGCIIPDIPWIAQRILLNIPAIDVIGLRIYVAIQASLLYCLVLSLALAMLSRKSREIFLILAINSLFHLLLDGAQTKWGNGVNLFIPFSWPLSNFGLFWPEHPVTYVLTFLGLLTLLLLWPKAIQTPLQLAWPSRVKTVLLALSLLIYLASPPLLFPLAYEADIHHSQTLRSRQSRPGKTIELDRAEYNLEKQNIRAYTGEEFTLSNPPKGANASSISIRGRFLSEEMIELKEFRLHKKYRDKAAVVGLLLTALLWMHSLIRQRHPEPTDKNKQ
ncbi:MAG: hypothetical protein ABFR63_10200 [Thermodesulfobacteriota bacterium]